MDDLACAYDTSEAQKRNDYSRPRQVSDERSHKLVTLAVKAFGRLNNRQVSW